MTHFRLETAPLLLEKLTRDLACFETWQNDADKAFNFFLTADAILDWLYPGPAGQQQRADVRNDPLLEVVRELALGTNLLLETKRAGDPPQTVLTVELSGRAVQKYGRRMSAIDFARRVHAYWKAQFP